MKYALIENNIVVQIQPNRQNGFIEVDRSVICGMIKNGDSFISPDPTPTSPYAKMAELEKKRTFRRESEARRGVEGAQEWLNNLDAEIEALRPID
jgi:hypothetical protein